MNYEIPTTNAITYSENYGWKCEIDNLRGILKQSRTIQFSQNVNVTLAANYYAGTIAMSGYNFAFAFTERPQVFVSVEYVSGIYSFFLCLSNTTLTSPGNIVLASLLSGTTTVKVNILAVGKFV